MKINRIILSVLKIAACILGFGGALLILGFVGGLENGQLTFMQFISYEFMSVGMILLAIIVYNIRLEFEYQIQKNK